MTNSHLAPLTKIVLGIDPGTASTGYGVVGQTVNGEFELLACGVIRTLPTEPMHKRLHEIFHDLSALLDEFEPSEMAVEKLFFGRNVTTAISVGQARGVVLLAGAMRDLNIAEYTPAEIKQSLTGYGKADKRQMQEMAQRLLGLSDIPRPDDAADGVAIAICHLQNIHYQSILNS